MCEKMIIFFLLLLGNIFEKLSYYGLDGLGDVFNYKELNMFFFKEIYVV